VVSLTFDDGPAPAWTPRVLELLARHRATFFVIGRSAAAHPELVRRVYAAGHGVGNHTLDPPAVDPPRRGGAGDRGGRDQRGQPAGHRGSRPLPASPYATVDAASAGRARALGLRLVLWDLGTGDWRRPGAGVIAGRVLSRVRSGDVVLLHDGGGDRSQTVAALQQVLASLSARGYRFRALCR
jgi:peptidoglycan/xylan/chitin deacetylase (PgdA/CDA1 family)